MDPKETELRKAKRRALLLLIAASLVFVVTALVPGGLWIDGIKAVSEAAMVGALADWFAVAALFRRVPIPLASAHTEIIPRNKDRIAENLATFVREKFLDVDSIVGLIRKHDPIAMISAWLTAPANAERLGDYVVRLMKGLLDLTDDARIQAFIRSGLHAVIDKVDFAKSAGAILDTLTKDGRHQDLLDQTIEQVVALLREEGTRSFISARIVDWLKGEYPKTEKLLPTGWIGDNSADVIASAVNRMLLQVSEDRDHQLRRNFDEMVHKLIVKLKSDPEFQRKGEDLKAAFRHGETLNEYTHELWSSLRDWLKRDLDSPGSALHARVAAMGRWIGSSLANDADLRASLNEHLEDAARSMAPEFARFLTHHIRDTVKNWDARDMSRQIELNIGKDLQYIRINGTLVGGGIGLVLYLCSHLLDLLRVHLAG